MASRPPSIHITNMLDDMLAKVVPTRFPEMATNVSRWRSELRFDDLWA